MNGVCGIQQLASRARRCGPRRGVTCVALVAVALGLTVPASIASAGDKPQPQRLWRAYPLNPAHSDTARTPGANPAPTTARNRPPSHLRAQATDSRGDSFPTEWIAIAATLVAVLVATFVVARRMTVHAGGRIRAVHSRLRVGLRARTLTGSIARMRVPSLPVKPRFRAGLASAAAAHGMADALLDNVKGFGRLRELVPHGAANGTEPEIEAAIQVDDQRADTPREKRIDRQSNRVLTSDRLVALERATLKRKRASDAARIKAKTWQPTVGTDTKSRDDKKLRAKKLAAPPQQPVKDLRAARPVAQPRSVPARCRIGWWRGYVKSEFYAKARMPDGREYVVRTSLGFRWSKSTPPPKEAPQVAEVHQKLVADLVADGWVVSGVGDEWWALELKLCGDETIDSQKGAVWPPTRTRSA